ncbi:TPA: DUF1778 domain-containing protein [Serratia fonticola]|jgi:uncharacterized protein (DUF1778 family)|uniref:Uncharacterized protein conserved in bacteria n=1 Tax=Serratia fonticola TaxID=47917 RepID=A0A3S4YLL1_SERFO|nr:DUF1778 domain-containing protein [Serratia fonticola]NTY85350.1 DUF1778 domain-containing protein [Serratia fonticola]NTZ11179.1 DUF1778 domain-containing protein [Serratia fonticola]CAI0757601.1 Uncharacterized protein conserved in bacteria [Serratia fonticola]CAI1036191.1 Uncharacterized protein conserved in bacteria [Serratia fonticola]CAI1037528.1 Uncharacterized protein conserved in bacteria [Serratia fonticola]
MKSNHLRGGAEALAIPEAKKTRLELRTTAEFKEKVRSASALLGVDMSAFIVLAAMELAQKTLDKQRMRSLTDDAWNKLNALLDAPVKEQHDDLERLMLEKSRYDKE